MATLEHIFSEGKSGLRSGSKLFRKTMTLFSEQPEVFYNKLVEAKIVNKNVTSINKLNEILSSHFAYGIRIDSPIELMRLKRFYVSKYEEECPWSDEEIKNTIMEYCFLYEGKGYLLDNKSYNMILNEINELKTMGAYIIYYDELYERNEAWFHKLGIFSAGMLKCFVKKYASGVICKKAYLSWESSNENELLKKNILSVWKDAVLHNYQELKEQLEYVPLEKIKYALANNSCFVWNSAETYTTCYKFIITEEEERTILEYVKQMTEKNESISFEDIPLQHIYDENFELSETAIFTLVFNKVLSEEFVRYNRAITPKSQENTAWELVESYCSSRQEVHLDELLEQCAKRTGTSRHAEALEIAHSLMVRVDKERFVSRGLVDFNIAGIDEVLDTIVIGDAIGLKEITSFALFPDCNFSWNLYLLESFCRKYSKTFKYMNITNNSRNAGAIVRKECNLDYHNLLAQVLVFRKVDLLEEVVMDFLYDHGFIARHSYKYIENLIETASRLNEGR